MVKPLEAKAVIKRNAVTNGVIQKKRFWYKKSNS